MKYWLLPEIFDFIWIFLGFYWFYSCQENAHVLSTLEYGLVFQHIWLGKTTLAWVLGWALYNLNCWYFQHSLSTFSAHIKDIYIAYSWSRARWALRIASGMKLHFMTIIVCLYDRASTRNNHSTFFRDRSATTAICEYDTIDFTFSAPQQVY